MSGRVFWITGLPGSGKTTLARALDSHLKALGWRPICLDGDSMREALGETAYDGTSRLRLAKTYGRLCQMLAGQGHLVICSTVSLFHDVQSWNRKHLPGYFEIFLDPGLGHVKARHPKDLYAKAERGELAQVPGVDLAYEMPRAPDLRFTEPELDLEKACRDIAARAGVKKP